MMFHNFKIASNQNYNIYLLLSTDLIHIYSYQPASV